LNMLMLNLVSLLQKLEHIRIDDGKYRNKKNDF